MILAEQIILWVSNLCRNDDDVTRWKMFSSFKKQVLA